MFQILVQNTVSSSNQIVTLQGFLKHQSIKCDHLLSFIVLVQNIFISQHYPGPTVPLLIPTHPRAEKNRVVQGNEINGITQRSGL